MKVREAFFQFPIQPHSENREMYHNLSISLRKKNNLGKVSGTLILQNLKIHTKQHSCFSCASFHINLLYKKNDGNSQFMPLGPLKTNLE